MTNCPNCGEAYIESDDELGHCTVCSHNDGPCDCDYCLDGSDVEGDE